MIMKQKKYQLCDSHIPTSANEMMRCERSERQSFSYLPELDCSGFFMLAGVQSQVY
jgi:hypothetical protein